MFGGYLCHFSKIGVISKIKNRWRWSYVDFQHLLLSDNKLHMCVFFVNFIFIVCLYFLVAVVTLIVYVLLFLCFSLFVFFFLLIFTLSFSSYCFFFFSLSLRHVGKHTTGTSPIRKLCGN